MGSLLFRSCPSRLQESPEIKDVSDNIFASLLDGESSKGKEELKRGPVTVVNGNDISTVIGAYHNPDWIIHCAAVCMDKLLLSVSTKSTKEHFIYVSRPSGYTEMAGGNIPVFSDATSVHYTLSLPQCVARTCQDPSFGLHPKSLSYRPTLALVQCCHGRSSQHSESVIPLEEDFYLQLFGPEYKLLGSPLLLMGCQNGHTYYCALNEMEIEAVLKLLYSLDQPVVAIHTVHFPRKAQPCKEDPLLIESVTVTSSESSEANALIMIGQKGKIVVCKMGNSAQSLASFAEFNVPGPILSSALLPDQCLLYSTMRGIYEICLKPQCMQNSQLSVTLSDNSPILVPEMAFRLPNRISCSTAAFLSAPLTGLSLISMSLNGHVSSITISKDGGASTTTDTSTAAQELKQSLTSIKSASEQIDALKGKLSSLNCAITELNTALSLLCDVATLERESPFRCEMTPAFEEVGVSMRKACIDVQLCYSGGKPLGSGWSLVVQLHPGSHEVSSRVVPLTGMAAGSDVQTRVHLGASSVKPLVCSLHCSLHYSADDLLEQTSLTPTGGVALLLCTSTFDNLDFALPVSMPPLELVTSEMNVESLLGPQKDSHQPVAPVHSLELALPHATSDPPTVLNSLLPPCTRSQVAGTTAEIKLRAYDGSMVCLRVEGEMKLVIQASSKRMLSEVCSSSQRRLLDPSSHKDDVSQDHLCNKLHALEVRMFAKCLTVDAYPLAHCTCRLGRVMDCRCLASSPG